MTSPAEEMGSQPEKERKTENQLKLRQVKNDVDAIYDMLGAVQRTQKEHSKKLDDLAAGQNRLGGTLMRQHNRLDEFAAVQEEHARRLVTIASAQARHGSRLDELAATQLEHSNQLDKLAVGQEEFAATQAEHSKRLDKLAAGQQEFAATQAEHSKRLEKVDGKLDTILGLLQKNPSGSRDS